MSSKIHPVVFHDQEVDNEDIPELHNILSQVSRKRDQNAESPRKSQDIRRKNTILALRGGTHNKKTQKVY